MVIVAGHVTVEPQQRESYLAGCVSIVERARGAAGCLDFAIDEITLLTFPVVVGQGTRLLPDTGPDSARTGRMCRAAWKSKARADPDGTAICGTVSRNGRGWTRVVGVRVPTRS